MELGGAEAALLGLLLSHDPAKADLDVFIYDHRGPSMKLVSDLASNYNENENENNHAERIHLLPQVEAYSMLERPISEVIKRGFWKVAIARLFGRYEAKRYSKNNIEGKDNSCGFTYQQRRTVKVLPKINPEVEYDLAISFLTPHYIALEKVRAKKRLAWIHTDYTNIFINREMELKMWSPFDYIASISEEVGNKFCEVFPTLRSKIIPIENIISPEFVRRRAEAPTDLTDFHRYNNIEGITSESQKKELILLSIGRVCYQKNFDNVPYMAKVLIERLAFSGESFGVHWYIIGPGEHAEIDALSERLGVSDVVTFLGPTDNPYPYIKACDIYVQPSRYEGKSVTVREAQILCKPVVVTNYPTAPSQIKDGIDGVIVPMDNEGCAKGIAEFILNKEKQNEIVKFLKTHDYGNTSEIEKIYRLVES